MNITSLECNNFSDKIKNTKITFSHLKVKVAMWGGILTLVSWPRYTVVRLNFVLQLNISGEHHAPKVAAQSAMALDLALLEGQEPIPYCFFVLL